MNIKSNIVLAGIALLMTACANDELPLTGSDESRSKEIAFSLSSENAVSRASRSGYGDYDYDRDPHTIGVFGYHDLTPDNFAATAEKGFQIFNNLKVEAKKEDEVVVWSYPNKRYWIDYENVNSFDFFAYMPKKDGAKLVNEKDIDSSTGNQTVKTNRYTLSFPVEIEDGDDNPNTHAVLAKPGEALICAEPVHKSKAEGMVSLFMDQTLAAYAFQFQLSENMAAIRNFVVKSVKIYGEDLPYAGTVSRTYEFVGTDKKNVYNGWANNKILWSEIKTTNIGAENSIAIPYVNNPNKSQESIIKDAYVDGQSFGTGAMRIAVSQKKFIQWGDPIYVIPTGFHPTIEVVYDDVVKDEKGNWIVTREDVKSTIQFKQDIFGSNSEGALGKITPIQIQIVPKYLYVLADADQRMGYLVFD